MYLKAIEIAGFKSFAQRMHFQFEKGITGIVGPNGSGKSNVADAVRWVLGEQSAKQLRSTNMQDVIFAGTQNRKPLGYAYVGITFDNTDHALAIDFEEVTIGRRVYKSGESEYLLNGSPCRLKDVQELFYDTGIGKEGYSIIGQGQIDKILSGKAEERRELFDEAAGIVKFKKRKQIAFRKLEKEQQNFERVNDLLVELEHQKEPLLKQAETAKKYLEYYELLKKSELNQFLAKRLENDKQLKEIREKNSVVEEHLFTLRQKADIRRNKVKKLQEDQELIQNQIERLQQEILTLTKENQHSSSQIALYQEQIRSEKEKKEQSVLRLTHILEEQKSLKEQEQAAREKEKLSIQELIQYQNKISLFRENNKTLEEKINELKENISSIKRKQLSLMEEKSIILQNQQKSETRLEENKLRYVQLQGQFLEITAQISFENEKLEELSKSGQMLSLALTKQEEKIISLQQQKKQMEKTVQQNKEDVFALHHQEQLFSTRYEALSNLAQRYEGYGNSVRVLMDRRDEFQGIKGVVADLIQVEKIYEVAVEIALGGAIQNIVTDTEYTAKASIDFLKKKRAGRATFLPISIIRPFSNFKKKEALKEKGAIALASELVQTKEEYQKIIYFLLGKILVVDTMENALKIAGKYQYSFRIVTLEGEQINIGGSLSGGAYKNSGNLLGRKRELEDLQNKQKQIKEEIDVNQHQLDMLIQEQKNIVIELDRQLMIKNTAEEKLRNLSLEQRKNTLSLNSFMEKKRDIELEKAELEEKAKEYETEIEQLVLQVKQIQIQLEEVQVKSFDLEQKLSSWSEVNLEKEREITDLRMQETRIEQTIQFLKNEYQNLQLREKHFEEEKKELKEKNKNSDDLILNRTRDSDKEQQKTIDLTKQIDDLENKKEKVTGERESIFEKTKQNQGENEKLTQDIVNLDKENYRFTQQIERLEESKNQQVEYLWTAYELTPTQAEKYKDENLLKEKTKREELISKLKNQIKLLGNINVNAIEEYKSLEKRYSFMKQQHSDLEQARNQLNQLILELDEQMRRQFARKFKEIQHEFDLVFKQLFGGGNANLTLVIADNTDLLDAGIQIIAQPPGKKLQNMMQLSGGEKALTAISLLFAIQRLKPSPFCLLDEIEAALDDANVSRFADYLEQLKEDIQFIVITHRRGTMLIADRLYGITMQEKGISSLVSVDLTDAS